MYVTRDIGEYLDYIKNKDTILHNTGLIALENKRVLGVLEYRIRDNKIADITNLDLEERKARSLLAFLEEIEYWNPYIGRIVLGDRDLVETYREELLANGFKLEDGKAVYQVEDPLDLIEVDLADIKISQLTVSKEKLDKVRQWTNSKEDIVVNLYKLGDDLICIDGNTRLIAAYEKGMDTVLGYVTDDSYLEFYRKCVDWCEKEGVRTIEDLSKNIVSNREHKRLWLDRCGEYFDT